MYSVDGRHYDPGIFDYAKVDEEERIHDELSPTPQKVEKKSVTKVKLLTSRSDLRQGGGENFGNFFVFVFRTTFCTIYEMSLFASLSFRFSSY